MQLNIKSFTLVFLLIPCLFFSCNKKKDTKSNYVVSSKNPIKKTPIRVVSVSPAITEILFALDCGDRLIGRTEFCNYPPEVKKIKSIGGINNANLEEIIKLQPDLVITSSIFTKKMFETIEDAGIPIISFKETNTIEGLYETIEMLGKVMDKETKAKSIIDKFEEDLNEARRITSAHEQTITELLGRTLSTTEENQDLEKKILNLSDEHEKLKEDKDYLHSTLIETNNELKRFQHLKIVDLLIDRGFDFGVCLADRHKGGPADDVALAVLLGIDKNLKGYSFYDAGSRKHTDITGKKPIKRDLLALIGKQINPQAS